MALQTIDLTQAVVSWAALFCFVYSSAISLGFTFVKYIQAWLHHPFLFLILFIPYIWMIDMIVFIHLFLVPLNMNVISFPQGLNSEFDKAQFLRLYLCHRGNLPAPTTRRRPQEGPPRATGWRRSEGSRRVPIRPSRGLRRACKSHQKTHEGRQPEDARRPLGGPRGPTAGGATRGPRRAPGIPSGRPRRRREGQPKAAEHHGTKNEENPRATSWALKGVRGPSARGHRA